jgi:hypothetical protein
LSNQEVNNECRTNDGTGLEPSPYGKTAATGRGEGLGQSDPHRPAGRVLENLLAPGDRVVLEGNNQKQADFLSRMLAEVNPQKIHDLHMIMPSVGRSEHLDLFEKGIARKLISPSPVPKACVFRSCWKMACWKSAPSTPISNFTPACTSTCRQTSR